MGEIGPSIDPFVSLIIINYNSVMGCDSDVIEHDRYGQSVVDFQGYSVSFEVKSVNHRYCEIVFVCPVNGRASRIHFDGRYRAESDADGLMFILTRKTTASPRVPC